MDIAGVCYREFGFEDNDRVIYDMPAHLGKMRKFLIDKAIEHCTSEWTEPLKLDTLG